MTGRLVIPGGRRHRARPGGGESERKKGREGESNSTSELQCFLQPVCRVADESRG